MNTNICSAIAQHTAQQWSRPSALVGSGNDNRSSHNGLLTIFYSSLERAAHYGWLNAGRTLIDKTYINILWQAASLPSIGVEPTKIASNLDAFIRSELEPVWQEFEHLNHDEKHHLSIRMIEQAAAEIFGSGYQEQCASWLLFYLCPQLPIFPISDELVQTVAERLHLSEPTTDYAGYHAQCRQLYSRMLPNIHTTTPVASYGSEQDRHNIDQILRGSDCWQRHCFISQLQAS